MGQEKDPGPQLYLLEKRENAKAESCRLKENKNDMIQKRKVVVPRGSCVQEVLHAREEKNKGGSPNGNELKNLQERDQRGHQEGEKVYIERNIKEFGVKGGDFRRHALIGQRCTKNSAALEEGTPACLFLKKKELL